MTETSFITESPEETQAFGQQLAERLTSGTVVGLIGDLGSGKTCLVQSVCASLGIAGPVTSPTFILINEYAGRRPDGSSLPVYHFDLYRLAGEEDLLDLGSDDYFYGDGICLVEWADMAGDLLPPNHTSIRIEHKGETTRRFDVDWGNLEANE
ncbi:TPA: tRNA (adenosine(37)-N6)-threonylcarbamoyltransferase complex ATPase subunit type 1 TsaE [Candidatus Latescibacteria bacterium]|nr:tRNA (adenosine(37)-N6)-threonylcarbamoyltransferase complex ATPase subunit type 1 TsaE [Gemmatimonadota bacterium]HAA74021.1 tRNA (adenosine(37)-N6)-threonylcarbamoyltransferase complex ATPase subunit type 1 TsaE [Candidatus Latescibacterota bacterium]|tara:strand:+ start:1552 stop:2010 length:459 start_codon:yes stop_codon:yes gene_type:complete